MRAPSAAAGSPLTWFLALLFVALIDAAVTRTPLIWEKTTLWTKGRLGWVAFWQTYDVARKLYHPERAAAQRVALLGNSRVWFPGREPYVEPELRRLAPHADIAYDNLAIFGARIGDMEIVSRHLPALQPNLVILAISGSDLVATSWGELINPTGEVLDIGWRDGPLPTKSMAARVDRWVRTVWPLYRFRRFARAALEDRLWPNPDDVRYPDHFASPRAYFDFMHDENGAAVDTAYEAWLRTRDLPAFVAYLKEMSKLFGLTEPLPDPASLTLDSPGAKVLDQLLARMAAGPWKGMVLLLPENPLLEQDTANAYHRPGFSEHSAELIRQLAERHGIPVVDGRRWMPAEAFVDFLHVMPDLSGFQTPLAEEVLHGLGS